MSEDDWAFRAAEVAAPVYPADSPAGGLCDNCKQRPGTRNWAGDNDAVSIARNPSLLKLWCERCVVQAELRYCRKAADRIPTLEQQLRQLP